MVWTNQNISPFQSQHYVHTPLWAHAVRNYYYAHTNSAVPPQRTLLLIIAQAASSWGCSFASSCPRTSIRICLFLPSHVLLSLMSIYSARPLDPVFYGASMVLRLSQKNQAIHSLAKYISPGMSLAEVTWRTPFAIAVQLVFDYDNVTDICDPLISKRWSGDAPPTSFLSAPVRIRVPNKCVDVVVRSFLTFDAEV